MLKQTDILISTRNELKKLYPNFLVYLDDTKEGFDSPCFFLKLLIVRSQQSRALFLNDCTLYITYFAQKNETSAVELYDIKDNILNQFFGGLQVNERYIKFETVSCTTDGNEADIINFDLHFKYYDSIDEVKEQYTIDNIVSNENLAQNL